MTDEDINMLTRHDEIIKEHSKTLSKHDSEIAELTEFKGGVESSIQSLNKSVDNINSTARWGVGLLVPTFLTLIGILIALWKN